MARRGTKVGDAYISIHGDNSDWVKSARRVRDKWLGEEKQAGKKFEKVWADSIDRTIDRQFSRLVTSAAHRDFSDWVKQWGSMDEAARRFDATLDDIYDSSRKNNAATKEQAQTLRRHWEEWSKRERERLEYLDLVDQAYKENALYDKFRLENARNYRKAEEETARLRARLAREQEMFDRRYAAWRDKATTDFHREMAQFEKDQERARLKRADWMQKLGRMQEDALRLDRQRDRLLLRSTERYREIFEVQGRLSAADEEYVRRVVRDHLDKVESISEHYRRIAANREKAQARESERERLILEYLTKVRKRREDMTQEEIDRIDRIADHRVRTAKNVTDRVLRQVKSDVDREGGIFSRLVGSRNDLLNAIGRTLRPVEQRVERFSGRFLRYLTDPLDRLAGRLAAGGRVSRMFAALLSRGLVPALTALVPSVLAGSAALWVLFTASSAVASLLSALAGMVTALAGSLSFALAGALTSLLPMLFGVGAGLAALVVGVTGMTKAQKAALQPLKDWYDTLSRLVARNLFGDLRDQVSGLLDAVAPHLETVLSRSAKAISDTISGIIETLGTPEYQAVMDRLDEHVPGIVENIAQAMGNLGLSLASVASAISPQVEEILGRFVDTLEEWAAWAASPEGQTSIADWFSRAWDSAVAVYDVVKNLLRVLGTLFGMGKDTGDNWLEGWADALATFNEWLQTPEGREALDEWYQKAKDTASELGDLVDALAELFDTLDSPEGQQALSDIIYLLRNLAEAAEWAARATNGVNSVFSFLRGLKFVPTPGEEFINWGGVWENIKKGYNWLQDKWADLVEPINEWWGVDEWFDGLDFSGFWDNVKNFFSGIGKWFKTKALEFWQSGQNIAEWLIKGLAKGLYDTLVPDSIKPYFDNIILWVKQVFGIASPSTVMYDIGVDVIQGLINGIESMLGALGTAAQSVVDTLERIWNGGEGGFPGVVGRAVNEFADLVPGLSGVLNRAASAGAKGMSTIRSKVVAEAKPMPGKVRDAIANLSVYTAREGSSAASRGANAFSPYATRITAIASRAVSALRSTAGAMYSAGYAVGYNAGRGMVAGMKSQSSAVYATAASMAKRAISAAKSTLISRSPSRAMMRLGEYAVEGFLIPFQDSLGAVGDASEQMVQALLSPLSATSMFAQGKAATEGLLRGLGNARHQVNVDGMMVGDSARARTGHTTIIQEGAIRLESKAQYTQTSTEQFLDGLADRLVGV